MECLQSGKSENFVAYMSNLTNKILSVLGFFYAGPILNYVACIDKDSWRHDLEIMTLDGTKNLEEKDGQTQLLYYVSLIRACNKVL